ncbi:MAG TPA: hypothetical protein VLA17_17815 [Candidatus Limnocylindria bacterium]|nr:hypothetical protein [Candidatus Limnocylindria bacterium]
MVEVIVDKLNIRTAVPHLNAARNVFPVFRRGMADNFRVDHLQMIGFSYLDSLEVMKRGRRWTIFDGEIVEPDVAGVFEPDMLENGPAIAVG